MRKSAAPLMLSVAIAFTLVIQPATCSAAAVVIMQNYQRQKLLDESKAAKAAAIEAAKPKQNILLDVGIKSNHSAISSQGPVASGSTLLLQMTEGREYISSKTYADGVLTGVAKFNAVLGDEIVIVPSITNDGQVLVEVTISHGAPGKKSENPWADRDFVTERSSQTFLLGNGVPSVSRTISIPGVENGLTITLKANIQQD